jgi:hypothetical protein
MLTSLRELIEIDAFISGLRFFLDREGGTPTTAIADLASSLKAVARHHVRVEPHHLDQIGSIIRRLAPGRRGLTENEWARLRHFDDRENIFALLRLPDELMGQARRHRNHQRGAVRAQMAVAIEILLMAPVRMSNLTKLDIEKNLVRLGHGRALHIVIGAEEVKNRELLEYPLPPESVDLLERYIREFRPRLTSAGNTALFRELTAAQKIRLSSLPRSRDLCAPTRDYEFILTFFAISLPSCFLMPIRAPTRLSAVFWVIRRSCICAERAARGTTGGPKQTHPRGRRRVNDRDFVKCCPATLQTFGPMAPMGSAAMAIGFA